LPAPPVGDRRERRGVEQAFELLLVRRELEVGRKSVRRQRCVDARNPERRAVEVRGLGRSGEGHRKGAEFGCCTHCGLTSTAAQRHLLDKKKAGQKPCFG
jgi:hypothetical protein